ncbi:uncharacterized protein [Scyliorhinus torazame]
MLNQKEDTTDREDSSSDMDDPTAGNWSSDVPPQATESTEAMQVPNDVTVQPNSPKQPHLSFNPVVQEQSVQALEVQVLTSEPVAMANPHFNRPAPAIPQHSPQQLKVVVVMGLEGAAEGALTPSFPTPVEGRKVEGKTHHVSRECTRIPVAVQVNSTTSAASSEMWILRRELKALGATQILIGIIQLVFGVPLSVSLIYSVAGKSGVSFWTGIWYIISGSFTIELKRKPTRCIMKAGLLTNSISTAATAIGIIIYSISLLFTPVPELVYFSASTFSLTVGLLLFTVLEMAIAVIIAFYNYKSLYHFQNTYTVLHDVIAKHPTHSS